MLLTNVYQLSEAVMDACDHMGVGIVRTPWRTLPENWREGPSPNASLEPYKRLIWVNPSQDTHETWLCALHELEHLVFWRDDDPLMRKCDETLFMPWGVGALKAAGIKASVYFGSPFNRETGVGEMWIGKRVYDTVGSWKHPMRSAWYKRARAANIAAGTLDAAGVATWKMPEWSKIDIEAFYQDVL